MPNYIPKTFHTDYKHAPTLGLENLCQMILNPNFECIWNHLECFWSALSTIVINFLRQTTLKMTSISKTITLFFYIKNYQIKFHFRAHILVNIWQYRICSQGVVNPFS